MKKGLLAGVIVVTGLALAACGSKEETTSSGGWEKIDDGSTEDAEAASGSDFATAVEESEPEPIEVQVGRLIVEIPGYYTVDEDIPKDAAGYEYIASNDAGSFLLLMAEDVTGVDEAKFRNGKDTLEENTRELIDFGEMTLQNSQTAEYMGMPGFSYDYKITKDGESGDMDVDVFLDTAEEKLYFLAFIKIGNPPRDVATDYGNMMRNAQWAEASAETDTSRGSDFATPTEESSSSASSSSSSSSGVNPDLKAALDSYESMMNSYCDFMVKYQNASATDALSLMGDYTKMLGEYADAMSALSEIDEGSLSGDDLAYYLDVTNRVTKRLLEVGQ